VLIQSILTYSHIPGRIVMHRQIKTGD